MLHALHPRQKSDGMPLIEQHSAQYKGDITASTYQKKRLDHVVKSLVVHLYFCFVNQRLDFNPSCLHAR